MRKIKAMIFYAMVAIMSQAAMLETDSMYLKITTGIVCAASCGIVFYLFNSKDNEQ